MNFDQSFKDSLSQIIKERLDPLFERLALIETKITGIEEIVFKQQGEKIDYISNQLQSIESKIEILQNELCDKNSLEDTQDVQKEQKKEQCSQAAHKNLLLEQFHKVENQVQQNSENNAKQIPQIEGEPLFQFQQEKSTLCSPSIKQNGIEEIVFEQKGEKIDSISNQLQSIESKIQISQNELCDKNSLEDTQDVQKEQKKEQCSQAAHKNLLLEQFHKVENQVQQNCENNPNTETMFPIIEERNKIFLQQIPQIELQPLFQFQQEKSTLFFPSIKQNGIEEIVFKQQGEKIDYISNQLQSIESKIEILQNELCDKNSLEDTQDVQKEQKKEQCSQAAHKNLLLEQFHKVENQVQQNSENNAKQIPQIEGEPLFQFQQEKSTLCSPSIKQNGIEEIVFEQKGEKIDSISNQLQSIESKIQISQNELCDKNSLEDTQDVQKEQKKEQCSQAAHKNLLLEQFHKVENQVQQNCENNPNTETMFPIIEERNKIFLQQIPQIELQPLFQFQQEKSTLFFPSIKQNELPENQSNKLINVFSSQSNQQVPQVDQDKKNLLNSNSNMEVTQITQASVNKNSQTNLDTIEFLNFGNQSSCAFLQKITDSVDNLSNDFISNQDNHQKNLQPQTSTIHQPQQNQQICLYTTIKSKLNGMTQFQTCRHFRKYN